jgi:hypothetical protein
MPWDLLDRMRDEDSTDRRRWTRRLRKRGGRRKIDAPQAKAPCLLQVEDGMIVLYIDGERDTNFGYGVTLEQIAGRIHD